MLGLSTRGGQFVHVLAENLKEFAHIQVPLPVLDYSSLDVLTMDYIRGTKITMLSPLAKMDVQGGVLAEELFQAYLKQVLVDGFFRCWIRTRATFS